jgi:hypothetical protein
VIRNQNVTLKGVAKMSAAQIMRAMKIIPLLLTLVACAGTVETACADEECGWEEMGVVTATSFPGMDTYVAQGGDDCKLLPECDPTEQHRNCRQRSVVAASSVRRRMLHPDRERAEAVRVR